MTTRVLFVRHAAHDALGRVLCGRSAGFELNAIGRQQADMLAGLLALRSVGCVYASPQMRAHQTAAPIARACGVILAIEPALDEIDFGEWSGRRIDSLDPDPAWQRWNVARLHHRPPSGETMLEAQTRTATWLGQVLRSHPDTNLVAVTHGDVIKSALCFALGLSLDFHGRLTVDPCSVSTIVMDHWGLQVKQINASYDPEMTY